MIKALLELLADLLTGWSTKEALRQAGAPPDSLPGAVTIKLGLGSGFDREQEEARQRTEAVAFMRSQLGKGYQLGVEVPDGSEEESPMWDCSEFTEAAARVSGWSPALPDGAWQQYEVCRPVLAPKAGDLGFLWSDKRGMIGHVMMATGHGTVIHAVAGRGAVEDLDGQWVIHPRWRGWRRPPCFPVGDDAQVAG